LSDGRKNAEAECHSHRFAWATGIIASMASPSSGDGTDRSLANARLNEFAGGSPDRPRAVFSFVAERSGLRESEEKTRIGETRRESGC